MRLARQLVDATMLVLMVYLMGYRAGSGLLSHAICGTALLVLFVIHLLLNCRGIAALGPGRRRPNALRTLNVIVDLGLALAMLGLFASSAMLSGYVVALFPLSTPWYARTVHMVASAWFVLLTAFHLSLHAHVGLRIVWSHLPAAGVARPLWLAGALALSVLGIVCLVRSGLATSLAPLDGARAMGFGALGSELETYANLLGVIVGACAIAHLAQLALQAARRPERSSRDAERKA